MSRSSMRATGSGARARSMTTSRIVDYGKNLLLAFEARQGYIPASPRSSGGGERKVASPGRSASRERAGASSEWRVEAAFCENEPNDAERQACENEPDALSIRFVKTKPKFQLTVRYSPGCLTS